MKGEFFCGNCRHYRKDDLLAYTRPNGVKQCTPCADKASARRAQQANDVVGAFPDGTPKLRRHAKAGRENQKRSRYASGSAGAFFTKVDA